jgi:hypothetical protein
MAQSLPASAASLFKPTRNANSDKLRECMKPHTGASTLSNFVMPIFSPIEANLSFTRSDTFEPIDRRIVHLIKRFYIVGDSCICNSLSESHEVGIFYLQNRFHNLRKQQYLFYYQPVVFAITTPSFASRSLRLAATFWPCFRNQSMAASKSPLVSVNAFATIHHAGTSHLAQLINILCTYCYCTHILILLTESNFS